MSETYPRSPDKRAARLEEYLDFAMTKSDPLLANVEMLNSALLAIAFQLANGIEEMTSNPPPEADAVYLVRIHDQMLRYAKQIERYTQLTMKIERERSQSRDQLDALEREKVDDLIPNPDGGGESVR